MSEFYRVRLDAFEGPMDLLLYLIRRHEVDLHDIPVSTIAEQYMGFLGQLDSIDIELAGEFLVMAATLMELKSRILARETLGDDERDDDEPQRDEEDPRAELVRQLLAYKKYRDAADALERRKDEWSRRAPVRTGGVDSDLVRDAMDEMGELELEDLDLSDLIDAFRQIVESVNFDRLGEHAVALDETPIEEHAERIVADLSGAGAPRTLRETVSVGSRAEMIGVFLALLVLVRDQRVRFEPSGSEILLSLGEAPDNAGDGRRPADHRLLLKDRGNIHGQSTTPKLRRTRSA